MLTHLSLKNFVIVAQLELDFAAGFGTLTGETGAGKSILLDALTLILGARAEAGVVRAGCDKADLSAEFQLPADQNGAVWAWLAAQEFDQEQDTLLIRRVIDQQGKSRSWINGNVASQQQCRELGSLLLDVHGQHAHQNLLKEEKQRALVDQYGDHLELLSKTTQAFRRWQQAKTTWQDANEHSAAVQQESEQLRWQIEELDALNVSAEDWQALEVEHSRLAHASSLLEGVNFALTHLADDDVVASTQVVDRVLTRLHTITEFDQGILQATSLLTSVQNDLAEVVSSLRRYVSRLELDPDRLIEVESRIAAINNCARKYRCQPAELADKLASWQQRLQQLDAAQDMTALAQAVEDSHADYLKWAQQLSEKRAKTTDKLNAAVSQIMQQLALANGQFSAQLLPETEGRIYGLENIVFYVSGLAGTDAKPLAKVVSGGELSRISLALQVVTSRASQVPTLIFDEVDVGIGGGVAEIVGRLLHQLAHGGSVAQVLCVTHLPQVAARADWHFCVSKSTDNGETLSQVVLLDDAQRVEEIARMLGGVELTDITRQHAQELLAPAS